jgi:hypothetical protein
MYQQFNSAFLASKIVCHHSIFSFLYRSDARKQSRLCNDFRPSLDFCQVENTLTIALILWGFVEKPVENYCRQKPGYDKYSCNFLHRNF